MWNPTQRRNAGAPTTDAVMAQSGSLGYSFYQVRLRLRHRLRLRVRLRVWLRDRVGVRLRGRLRERLGRARLGRGWSTSRCR